MEQENVHLFHGLTKRTMQDFERKGNKISTKYSFSHFLIHQRKDVAYKRLLGFYTKDEKIESLCTNIKRYNQYWNECILAIHLISSF